MVKPENTTIEAQYVANTVGEALTKALAELVEKRPNDPIEYLANYLRKFAQNKADQREDEQTRKEIERLLKEQEIEKEREEMMKKEEEEIKLMEDNIKKEKEAEERRKREMEELARRKEEVANIPPALPVLQEEEDVLVEFGDNKLHELAAQPGSNLIQVAKDENISIAARNSQGLTVRDIAEQNNIAENVKQIDDYIADLVGNEDFKTLNDLVINGFKNIQPIIESRFGTAEQMSENEMKAQVEYLYRFLPEIEEKIRKIKEAIDNNDLRELKMFLDRRFLAYFRDDHGRTSLIISIQKGHLEIALFLIEKYPLLAKLTDCQGRSAHDYLQSLDKSKFNETQQKQSTQLEGLLKR